jgi:hypothetical protein
LQVEPLDIANFYRLKMDKTGRKKHYNESRPSEFGWLDEMCQHKRRTQAPATALTYDYTFTRQWADHLQIGGARDRMPNPWCEVPVTVSFVGKWGKPMSAADARASAVN